MWSSSQCVLQRRVPPSRRSFRLLPSTRRVSEIRVGFFIPSQPILDVRWFSPCPGNKLLLPECRQACERQELAFACNSDYGRVCRAGSLAWSLGYQCSHHVMPATLRRRGRPCRVGEALRWEVISCFSGIRIFFLFSIEFHRCFE